MLYFLQRFTISATGSMVPSSLFANIIDTKSTSVGTFSGFTLPTLSTGITLQLLARARIDSVTDGCSTALMATTRSRKVSATVLLASDPPEVKMISAGSAFINLATAIRALSIACVASCPVLCRAEALP